MTGREPGAGRECLHAEVGVRVLGDPVLYVPQRLADGGLSGELGAELGLVAGAPQEDDEVAGHGERHLPAVVLLHEGEREVDAGGDARRGGQPAVAHEDRFGVHLDRRVVTGEHLAERPVGGHAVAVELPGPGEEQRAGTDGDQLPRARGVRTQPVDQRRVGGAGPGPAGDEEHVRHAGVDECTVGDQGEAAGAADRRTGQGSGAQLVGDPGGPGGPGEDLHRAAHVEAQHVVEEHDEYGSLLHACHPEAARPMAAMTSFPPFPPSR